jgi:coenzyme F420-reducing hydrogenase delta subunit
MSSTAVVGEQMQANSNKNPKMAVFCCYHSAYEAADMAGTMRMGIPPGVRLIRVPCTGRVDILHIVKAIEKGYDGVLVLGCHEENCKFLRGNLLAHKRAEMAQKLLGEAGLADRLVEFHGVAANQPHRLVQVISAMYNRLASVGSK